MDGWSGPWPVLMMLLVLAIAAAVVVFAIREFTRRREPDTRPGPSPEGKPGVDPEPRVELERRYVRGEIGREQFLEMRDDLVGTNSSN